MKDDLVDAISYGLQLRPSAPFDYQRVIEERIAESFRLPNVLMRPRCTGRSLDVVGARIDEALTAALTTGTGVILIGIDEGSTEVVATCVDLFGATSDEG